MTLTVRLIACAAALALSPLLDATARAETIRLRADPWCPYNCEPWAPAPGFAVEIARAVYIPRGVAIDYATLPWARALAEARAGRIEGVIGIDPSSEEGVGFATPTESIGHDVDVLIMPVASPFVFRGVESLAGLSIGGTIGYTYGKVLQSYFDANRGNLGRIQLVGGDAPLETNLRKLQGGRISAIAESEFVARYTIAQLGLGGSLRVVSVGDAPTPIKIGFTATNPRAAAWAGMFDEGVAELRADGRLAAILARYGLSDWAAPTAVSR